MIRETVLDGEPALDVDTEEEFDRALGSGVWVIAPPTADALSPGTPGTRTTRIPLRMCLLRTTTRTQRGKMHQTHPGWLIRRLWAWVRG